MCANSEGSGRIARMHRLAWAFASRLCDKYHNLMSRPNWNKGYPCVISYALQLQRSERDILLLLCLLVLSHFLCICIIYEPYMLGSWNFIHCKFTTFTRTLFFANIREFDRSQIQHSHKLFTCTCTKSAYESTCIKHRKFPWISL